MDSGLGWKTLLFGGWLLLHAGLVMGAEPFTGWKVDLEGGMRVVQCDYYGASRCHEYEFTPTLDAARQSCNVIGLGSTLSAARSDWFEKARAACLGQTVARTHIRYGTTQHMRLVALYSTWGPYCGSEASAGCAEAPYMWSTVAWADVTQANWYLKAEKVQDWVPPSPIDPDKNHGTCDSPRAGNPISIATGAKEQHALDVPATAAAPQLRFGRRYSSVGFAAATALGTHWRHTFARRVERVSDHTVRLVRPNGNRYTYARQPDGSWAGDPDVRLTLAPAGAGWWLTAADGTVETYDPAGRLVRLAAPGGLPVDLAYDDQDRLGTAHAPNGQALRFLYDTAGRLRGVIGPDGEVRYGYDAVGNLATVTYPDGRERRYHYEDARFPHALTGLTDERAVRYASWTYDAAGRAVSSEHAGGADRTVLAYHDDGRVTVTNALGKEATYHFELIHGVRRVTRVEGHPTVACAGANQAYTYTPEGWLASKTDWQGHLTTYQYDDRGLEISRTEAAGTPEARTITTDWHPTLRLPVTITEPHQLTTIRYDAQGRVLSRVVTPRP